MDGIVQVLVGSFLSSLGVGSALIFVLKKLVEGKIENAATLQLDKARHMLQKQTVFESRRLEAYRVFLSSAYRCRNFIRCFSGGNRTNWLYEISGKPPDLDTRHEEVRESYESFVSNLKKLEDVLYDYRLYFEHDSFVPLHLFKRESVRFRLALDEAVLRIMDMSYHEARQNREVQASLDSLETQADVLDEYFEDLEKEIKREVLSDGI